MNTEQKFKYIISKAAEGGWEGSDVDFYLKVLNEDDTEQWGSMFAAPNQGYFSINAVIFSHDFAKSLVGDKLVEDTDGYNPRVNARNQVTKLPAYRLFLQNAVLHNTSPEDLIDWVYSTVEEVGLFKKKVDKAATDYRESWEESK